MPRPQLQRRLYQEPKPQQWLLLSQAFFFKNRGDSIQKEDDSTIKAENKKVTASTSSKEWQQWEDDIIPKSDTILSKTPLRNYP